MCPRPATGAIAGGGGRRRDRDLRPPASRDGPNLLASDYVIGIWLPRRAQKAASPQSEDSLDEQASPQASPVLGQAAA